MAVSFKVPASPKRSIFVIDEFQGVDLTNTGSNIDEHRSPNAENMVRYVPGKVRKRTGYQTKVEFSNRKDVNRAKNTSDEYVRIENIGTTFGNRTTLAELYEEITDPYIYMNITCKGTYEVGRSKVGGGGVAIYTITDAMDGYVSSYNTSTGNKYYELYVFRLSNNADDYFEVKNVRVCLDTEATSAAEWKGKTWESAPEDKGIIFQKNETTRPVYGCHLLRNGVFEGNRVKNVNRVLNTSDTYPATPIACDDTNWVDIYQLGNAIYRTQDVGEATKLIIEFDYICDNKTYIGVAGWYGSDTSLIDTGGDEVHYYLECYRGAFSNKSISLKTESGTSNVQIKNMSVLYEKDENYEWSVAPEDNGDIFHIEDVYNVGSKNYATLDSYSYSYTPAGISFSKDLYFADASSNVKGFVKVSFDLYTSTETEVNNIQLTLADDTPSTISGAQKTFYSNVNNEHIEWYTSASSGLNYIDHLWIEFNLKTTSGECTFRISNLKVQEISARKSYDISEKYYIYHVGKKLFSRASNSTNIVEIYNDANEHLSQAWQLNEKLFILDGKNIYSYAVGDENIEVLTGGSGYIPLVTFSKSPNGGGTSYESLNMLQPGFYEQFVVTSAEATEKTFHLSFSGLDSTPTKAWLLDSNGNWIEKVEGTDYSVDRGAGTITFVTAPGVTPLTGEDNVKILAYRTIPGYADRVAKCTIGTLFGVGGAADRLFLSGNPDYPNWDFYSEQYNPTYFPDTGYSSLGSAASAIVGYAIVNNYLATFKDDFDSSQAVFIREGDLIVDSDRGTSEPAFKLINTLQGNGVVAPYSFGYLQTEPLFLTKSGIYAITAQDITGEKYSQNRSFYLNGSLTKEDGLENAVATVFDDQYILAINNKLYILDGLQATRTDRSEPYATRQYVAFYCTNVPSVSIWTDDQALWIGTTDGRICRFATDVEDIESYNDDGQPIYCCWETPDLSGKLFYKNKTFRYFAIRMMQALKTSVKMYARKMGTWSFIKEDTRTGIAFDFETIDFERFSFSTDRSEKVVHTKVRVKKVDKARFKVENDALNEPFGLFDWALEYIESGNFKG